MTPRDSSSSSSTVVVIWEIKSVIDVKRNYNDLTEPFWSRTGSSVRLLKSP